MLRSWRPAVGAVIATSIGLLRNDIHNQIHAIEGVIRSEGSIESFVEVDFSLLECIRVGRANTRGGGQEFVQVPGAICVGHVQRPRALIARSSRHLLTSPVFTRLSTSLHFEDIELYDHEVRGISFLVFRLLYEDLVDLHQGRPVGQLAGCKTSTNWGFIQFEGTVRRRHISYISLSFNVELPSTGVEPVIRVCCPPVLDRKSTRL